MRVLFFLCISAFFLQCKQSPSIISMKGVALEGIGEYDIEDLGNGVMKAVKFGDDGIILEKGTLRDNAKHGSWMTFYKGGEPKTIESYIDGRRFGEYIEFDDKGRFKTVTAYADDKLHGVYQEFTFYKQLKELHYKHGIIDGTIKEFSDDGSVFRTVEYKDGIIDGKMQYYNPEGEMTMEYTYKKGEVVK